MSWNSSAKADNWIVEETSEREVRVVFPEVRNVNTGYYRCECGESRKSVYLFVDGNTSHVTSSSSSQTFVFRPEQAEGFRQVLQLHQFPRVVRIDHSLQVRQSRS